MVPIRADADAAVELREARARLVADPTVRGLGLSHALSELYDRAFADLLASVVPGGRVAVVALGSYGRRELCPGSDVDVLLLHGGGRSVAVVADALWYPIWDAGLKLGHGTATVREQLSVCDAELDSLTAALDARHVSGDAALTAELVERVRALATRRRSRVLAALGAGVAARRQRVGLVSEMLEPDLKDGGGGLRDLQALAWAGWAVGPPGGVATMVERGYAGAADAARLAGARDHLLDVRIALHRVNGGRNDRLVLEDQDAVARALGTPDADALVRALSSRAREVAWVVADAFARLADTERGPAGRAGSADRPVAPGVVVRDRRVALAPGAEVTSTTVLRAAAAAAGLRLPFDRTTLERLGEARAPARGAEDRLALVELLRTGSAAVAVVEALDHAGAMPALLPEWAHVRSLPQRNAYHRHTVDRHLLEAVAECAALLDDDGFDGSVAAELHRPDLLLLGALLHDVGKGRPGDHSEAGVAVARAIGERLDLPADAVDTLAWLVRHHLALADTASRRDLADPETLRRVVELVGDAERLRLLYLLTVGDSRATGPAAWSASKGALLRELFLRARTALARPDLGPGLAEARRAALRERIGDPAAADLLASMPEAYAEAFEADEMARHAALLGSPAPSVAWDADPEGHLRCTVVAADRPGLLAAVATCLALTGVDIRAAWACTNRSGLALEVFTGVDRFERVGSPEGAAAATRLVLDALDGRVDLDGRLAERVRRYRRPAGRPGPLEVRVDEDASASATVVEIHADDAVGLLARVAGVLTDLGLDVAVAKVATLGDRVVDVFYVRTPSGSKVADPALAGRLHDALARRLADDAAPPA